MSNTVKIEIIFLACLLNLFQATASKESILQLLQDWKNQNGTISNFLPDLDDRPNIGVAGLFRFYRRQPPSEAQTFPMPHLGMGEIKLIGIQYIV